MNKNITTILVSIFLLFTFESQAQDILKGSKIKWQNLETAINNNPENKNFYLFIYADWCDFCKKTAETTLEDETFVNKVNNDFIPIKLNANSFETIHILDTDFEYDEASGYHGLPIVLLEGQMNFPSFVFMTPEFTMISKIAGHQEDIPLMNDYLSYLGSNAYLTTSWNDYNTNVLNN